jgi:hypothetical protein
MKKHTHLIVLILQKKTMDDIVLLTRNGKSFITYLKKDTGKIKVAKENGFRDPTEKELSNYLIRVGMQPKTKAKETETKNNQNS